MQLQCRPSTPWQASHRHIGLHVCASVKALRPHEAAAARLYQQTTSTAAPKPLCLARVVEVLPGCKGLIAAQQLQPGQAAVLLPSYNSLSVPLSSEAVYLWECEWLEPFERAHGPLPAALVDLLTDHTGFSMPCDVKGTYQLTTLLLYVRQLAVTATSAGKRSFWADWLRLLPGLDHDTAPFGAWQHEELLLLRYQPYKAAMSASNAVCRPLCEALLDCFSTQLPGVHLASSVAEVMEALHRVKTRCIGTPGCLSVLPMHDFINHSDDPNCLTLGANTPGWHVVLPTSPVPTGAELFISYSHNEPLSNLDTLLAWGFTGRPSPLDPVLPLAYRALPALQPQLVASAAARVLFDSCADGFGQHEQQSLQAQLVAAAASLPLGALGTRGRLFSAAAAGAGHGLDAAWLQLDGQYPECASLYIKTGLACLAPWLTDMGPMSHLLGTVSQAEEPVSGALICDMYTHSNSKQQQSVAAALQHMAAVALRKLQNGGSVTEAQQPSAAAALLHQQLQLLSVQACSAAAQLQLLYSNMTTDQVVKLHAQQQTQQQQQQQQQQMPYGAAEVVMQAADQPSSRLSQHNVAWAVIPAAGTQATPGSSPRSWRQGQSATAPEHWLRAQELQLEVVPYLLVLQACLVQGAARGSVCSRAGAAAQVLLNSVQPGSSLHEVYLLVSKRPAQPYKQEKLLQHLLCLQEQQLKDLSACKELQGGGRWSSQQQQAQQGLRGRAVVAAEINRRQESLLCVSVELLREAADALRSGAQPANKCIADACECKNV